MIRNRAKLLDHGLVELRGIALDVAETGLVACDPGAAVERLVRIEDDALVVGEHRRALDPRGRVVVLGAGKASLKVVVALERVLGERLDGGIVTVRHGEAIATPARVTVVQAGHPLPDDASFHAAKAMLAAADALGPDDLLIACFTGGSSALASLPPPPVGADEKRDLHEKLLAAGLPIAAVNTVRKHVSAFKGGRLALAAAPAAVVNLTVSDVPGDRLDVLTDPSVQDLSAPEEARTILRDAGLWEAVAPSIRAHLDDPKAVTPDLSGVEIVSILLVTGASACTSMAEAARDAGFEPVVIGAALEGEAVEVGRSLAVEAVSRTDGPRSVLIGCGGESTVRLGVADSFGEGGPNQEAALAAAGPIAGLPFAAVFLDTDGSDGGTPVAGAIIDGATAERADESGLDLQATLAAHRSGAAVRALGDGICTGPTATNVNDLFAIVVG